LNFLIAKVSLQLPGTRYGSGSRSRSRSRRNYRWLRSLNYNFLLHVERHRTDHRNCRQAALGLVPDSRARLKTDASRAFYGRANLAGIVDCKNFRNFRNARFCDLNVATFVNALDDIFVVKSGRSTNFKIVFTKHPSGYIIISGCPLAILEGNDVTVNLFDYLH
jgi:hypothetical protein